MIEAIMFSIALTLTGLALNLVVTKVLDQL